MPVLDDLRRDVLAFHSTVVAETADDLGPVRRAALDDGRARLESGRYHVVVCGEFRRGKSSLLNALVERRALFPVDVDVTTAVVSTLAWSETEQAVVHFAADPDPDAEPGAVPESKIVTLSEVAGFVTEQANPGNERQVARVEMSAPIEALRSGMVLVDTPGVGSLNPAHTVATRAFLPAADAIVFVAAVQQPLSTVELDFLEHAVEQCPVVLCAVTMIDKPTDPEPGLTSARERVRGRVAEVAQRTGYSLRDVAVVGVSSHRKRRAAETGDGELLADSGFPALETELWTRLAATCGVAQLERALDAVDAAIADADAPVSTELTALSGDGELERLDAELSEAQQSAANLKSGGARWRTNLAQDLKTGAREPRDRLSADFDALRERFRRDADGDEALTDPDAVVARVSQAAADAVARAEGGLADLVARLGREYAHRNDLEVRGAGWSPPAAEIELADGAPASDTDGHARFRKIYGGGTAGAGAVGLGMWAAAFFIPVTAPFAIGAAVVGLLAGMLGGARHQDRIEEAKRRKEARRYLREQVMPRIDAARRQVERAFIDKIDDARRDLVAALDEHLAGAAETLDETVARLRATRKRTAAERQARTAELTARHETHHSLGEHSRALRAHVTDLGADS